MRHGRTSKKNPVILSEAEREKVEYTDENGRLLLLGPRSEAIRFGLRHRVVSVALRDRKGRIYIRRRPAHRSFPGLWELSAIGHVRIGEACEDAARRALQTMIHVTPSELVPVASEKILARGEKLHVILFTAYPSRDVPQINPEYASDGMFLDCDELLGLVTHFQELLSPALLWAFQNGLCPHRQM